MSDRHRGVPQIHIDSAESEMYPSNVEQVLRWGLLPEPQILEVENRQGLQSTRSWKPSKGNGQSSAVPAPGPLGPGDSVAEKDHDCSVPDAGSLSPSSLFDFLSCFGEGPCNECNREWGESAHTESVYEGS